MLSFDIVPVFKISELVVGSVKYINITSLLSKWYALEKTPKPSLNLVTFPISWLLPLFKGFKLKS